MPSYRKSRVYPRVCGGTIYNNERVWMLNGLSPRVRGNRVIWLRRTAETRSIPACAGEPGTINTNDLLAVVYPRVCGGTPFQRGLPDAAGGLSPRVRGNLYSDYVGSLESGSIPACAGEPSAGIGCFRKGWVYPRVCGGTTG